LVRLGCAAVPRLVGVRVGSFDERKAGAGGDVELRGCGAAEDGGAASVSGREEEEEEEEGGSLWRGLRERVWGGGRRWSSLVAKLVAASSVWVTSAAIVVVLLTSAPLDATAAVMAPRKLRGDELATVQLFQENTPSVVYITNLAVRYVPIFPISEFY
jgi:hypothetical protein